MIQQFPLAGTTTSFYVTFFSSFFKIFFQEHYYICSKALSFSYSLKLSYLYPIRMHLTFCINSSPHLTHFQPIKTKIIAFDISASLLATNCTMHIHLQPWHPFYHSWGLLWNLDRCIIVSSVNLINYGKQKGGISIVCTKEWVSN